MRTYTHAEERMRAVSWRQAVRFASEQRRTCCFFLHWQQLRFYSQSHMSQLDQLHFEKENALTHSLTYDHIYISIYLSIYIYSYAHKHTHIHTQAVVRIQTCTLISTCIHICTCFARLVIRILTCQISHYIQNFRIMIYR